MANLEVLQNIASLQKNSSETIMDVIVSEELLANANYPRSYTGTIVDSTSMPNTGQFRIQYIPYYAYNEGYAVQIAWGAVTNDGLWYRRSHGATWQPWAEFATKADVVRKVIWMPDNTSIDDVIETGIYKCTTWVTAPTGNSDNQGTIVCVNYGGDTNQSWTHQTFYSAHYNKVWTRNKANVDWTDWVLVGNTRKTSFSCTPYTDITILSQNCYIQNDRAYVDVVLKRTDDGAIAPNIQHTLFSVPHVPSTPVNLNITGWWNGGSTLSAGICAGTLFTNSYGYTILTNSSTTTILRISCEYDI